MKISSISWLGAGYLGGLWAAPGGVAYGLSSPTGEGGTLLEVGLPQRRHTDRARVMHGLGEVDGLGVGGGHRAAVDGTVQSLGRGSAQPAAGDEALQESRHGRECAAAVGLPSPG